MMKRRRWALGCALGFLLVLTGAPSRAALTIEALQATDVTPSGFAVTWQASGASTPRIAVFADAAGTAEITGQLEATAFPLQGGDPALAEAYQNRQVKEALRSAARALGLAKVAVQGCAPDTTYYVKVYAESSAAEVAEAPAGDLLPVRTARENAFVPEARQLLVTVSDAGGTLDSTGWLVRVSSPDAMAPVTAFVRDGADANQAAVNLARLFGANGVNWTPTGAVTLGVEVLGPAEGALLQTIVVDFAGSFAVAATSEAAVTGGTAYAVTVTVSPVDGGSVTGAGTYNGGDSATLTAAANPGYRFTGWSGDATGTTNPLTVTVDAAKSITASFERITYAVSVAADPAEGGTVDGAGTYNAGDPATLTAAASPGYRFTGWSGDATGAINPLTLTVDAAKSITASFERITYAVSVTADPAEGGTVDGAGTYNAGDSATLTASASAGYQFSGWAGDATGTTNPLIVTVDSAKSITANFSRITYAVTVTANPAAGGSVTGAGTYSSGTTATLSATANPGYRFTGWSGDAAGSTNPLTLTVNAAKAVTATFVQTFTVTATASPAAGGTVTGGGSFDAGATASITATANPGYRFTGWSGDATGTTNPVTLTVNAAKSVTATFVQTFTVTAAASPTAGGTVTGGGSFDAGATATLTATANPGYRFTGWSGDATGTTNPLTLTVDAAKAVTATFVQTFTVTAAASPAAGGTVTGGGSFDAGATATLTATANPGYRFTGWSGDATGTANPLTLTVDVAKSVTAQFGPATYVVTVTPSPAEGGSATGAGTYDAGAAVTLTATANPGYRFTGWSGDATGATNPLGLTVGADLSVLAQFAALGAPVVDPIGPQAVDEGQLLAFSVTATDPDQDPVTIAASGLPAGAQFDGASFRWVPTYRQAGSYEVTFTASDGTLTGPPAIVAIHVRDVPQNPTAAAGPDQTVASAETVTLDGSNSSDPDGTLVSYAWVQVGEPAVTLSDPATAATTFVAPAAGANGLALVFHLTVTDDSGLQATDEVLVNVTDTNRPPTADAGPDQTVVQGATVTLEGANSSDPEQGPLSYLWTKLSGPDVVLADATLPTPSFVAPTVAAPAALVFELTVTDAGGLMASDRTTVNVLPATGGNIPPTADAGPDQEVEEGAEVTLDGSASVDPDGVIVSYRWEQTDGTPVTLSDPAAASATFTSPSVGPAGEALTFELTVTDDGGFSASDRVLVAVANVNQAPVADAGSDQGVDEGKVVTLDGTASYDPDGTVAAYLWSQVGGPAVTLSSAQAARPSFTAPEVSSGGATLEFELTVTDDLGLAATDRVAVEVGDVPSPDGDGGGGGGGCFVAAAGGAGGAGAGLFVTALLAALAARRRR